jgi:hypothetical protein
MPRRDPSPNGRLIVFKELYIGDVEDPQLYAAFPLYEWEKSEHGNWVMNHAIEEPVWHTFIDQNSLGYKVRVTGRLTEADEIIYHLKFGHL